MFMPNPDFFSKKVPDPGSGSATQDFEDFINSLLWHTDRFCT
jgi:hypothetical protein